MAPFFKKTTATAEIELTPKAGGENYNSSANHFLSDEIVTGSALFSLPQGAALATSTIALKGMIKTITEDSRNGAVSKQWRTEKLTFLGVSLDSKVKSAQSVDGTVRIPFLFNLNECEKLATLTSRLPPSIDSKSEGQKSSGTYEIAYTITATALSVKNTAIASISRKIYIDQVSADSFSDSSSDTPGEYFWAKRVMSRSKSFQNSHQEPLVELAGQEPSAIALHADDVRLGSSTDVPFIVKLSPPAGRRLSDFALPKECKITANLITKTHMTPDGIKSIAQSAHRDYIRIEGQQTTKTDHSHHQDYSIPLEQWERSIQSESTDSFAVARFAFPFTLEGGALPKPTFYTPLLSRRYYLEVSATFDGSSDTFSVQMPFEITHGSGSDSDSEDEKFAKIIAAPHSKIGPVMVVERRLTAP